MKRHVRLLSEDGLAMVELALVTPFLLLLVFAMVDFGKTFVYWADETHLSREAARHAATNSCGNCGGQSMNTWVIATASTAAVRTNARLTVRFEEQAGAPVPQNHCHRHPVTVTVAWPNYQLIRFATIASMGASTSMRLEKDWHGDPATGKGSVSDAYDVEPGSASTDACLP